MPNIPQPLKTTREQSWGKETDSIQRGGVREDKTRGEGVRDRQTDYERKARGKAENGRKESVGIKRIQPTMWPD